MKCHPDIGKKRRYKSDSLARAVCAGTHGATLFFRARTPLRCALFNGSYHRPQLELTDRREDEYGIATRLQVTAGVLAAA